MIIRNFSIVAHIDHGKTTLTDRLLLLTGTISERQFTERMLDSNPIEQERGITIKMAPVRMKYALRGDLKAQYNEEEAIFNLIDTPGHVDFSYEVSRSLSAVEGVVLLVDATQGIQAQTLAHYYHVKELGLAIIPVINKVDMSTADVEGTMLELMESFGFAEEEIVQVSAKTGIGVEALLEQIIKRVPAPEMKVEKPLKALIFSAFFHPHKGVVTAVRVREGHITPLTPLTMMVTKTTFAPPEIGIFNPQMQPVDTLGPGEVGYLATALKDIRLAQVGETVTTLTEGAQEPLPGYKLPQLMVYMDFYPVDGDSYQPLVDAVDKLKMHDAALAYTPTHSLALGNGLRMGFLGVLHAEIVRERLKREYGMDLVTTAPTVRYEVTLTNQETKIVKNATELPDPSLIKEIREPMALMRLYSPKEFLGAIFTLAEDHRGKMINLEYIGDRAKITYWIPLAEIIITFFDELKSATSGYASLDYEVSAYEPVDAVKMTVLINKELVEAFSQIVVRDKVAEVGKALVSKLKEVIPRQLFGIPIQAAVGGTIVARETISAFRKDVTAKLYGGDVTRRLKLLEKQKKGKERRGKFGKVEIPPEAFMEVLKRG